METKPTFNLILLAFLLFTVFGCNRTPEKNNTLVSDENQLRIENIELNELPDSTYTQHLKNDSSIIFQKSSSTSSTEISIRTFEERAFVDADEFTRFAENYLENQMKSLEMKSLHFNTIGFKKTTCLKFDGTFRDSTNIGSNKEYISHEGYLCIIPDNKSRVAEIKVVHYSTERLMPNDVIYAFQSMTESMKFTKN